MKAISLKYLKELMFTVKLKPSKQIRLVGIAILFSVIYIESGAQCPTPSISGSTVGCAPGVTHTLSATSYAYGRPVYGHRWFIENPDGSLSPTSPTTQGHPTGSPDGMWVSTLVRSFSSTTVFWVSSLCGGSESAMTRGVFTFGSNNSIAIIPSASPTSVCASDFTLTANKAVSYTWYLGDPDLSGTSLGSQATITPTQNGTYYLKGQTSDCNVVQKTQITVTFAATMTAPEITVSSPQRCQGNGTTKFNSAATNYESHQWTIENAGGSVIDNTGLVTWDPGFYGTATVKLLVYGCTGSGKENVSRAINYTVNQSVPLILQLGGPSEVCAGSAATYHVNVSVRGQSDSFEWLRDGSSVLAHEPMNPTNLTISNWDFLDGTTISCRIRSSVGCISGSSTVTSQAIAVTRKTKGVFNVSLGITPVHNSGFAYCPGEAITFTATANAPVASYSWSRKYTSSGGYQSILGTGNSVTISNLLDGESLSVTAVPATNTNLCLDGNSYDDANTENIPIHFLSQNEIPPIYAYPPTRCQGLGTTEFDDYPCYSAPHQWTISNAGSSQIDPNTGTVTWDRNFFGTATIKVTMPAPNGNSNIEQQIQYVVKRAGVVQNQNLTKCNWESIELGFNEEVQNVRWYNYSDQLLGTNKTWSVGRLFTTGNYQYKAETISPQGCVSIEKSVIQIHVIVECDDRLNTIETKLFDESDAVYSNTKSYFDFSGKPLQTQTKTFSQQSGVKIFASQNITDQLDRTVGSILPALIPYSDFNYHYGIMLNNNSLPYDYVDFDTPGTLNNPNTVQNTAPGTVGWYYSTNNTEKKVPSTSYPYSRTEFYNDGTGEVKRSASAGDHHRSGTGHEVLSGTFPVYHELDDYLSIRRNANQINLPDNLNSINSLMNNGVQSVVRDQNGKYAINITDKSGKAVMSARIGTVTDNALVVDNLITSSGDPASSNYRTITYLYILEPQVVSITGSNDFVVEDLVNDIKKAPGQTFANASNQWPIGFYRIVLNNAQSTITVSYKHYFKDIACQFYDDAGRLKSSISPNGFLQLKNNVAYANIDKTVYHYNHQGWLLSMTEPDAGTSRYTYRRDGSIRFSQNAKQYKNEIEGVSGKGKYSYTNYDKLGRPVESGEYIGNQSFSGGTLWVEVDQQIDYNENDKIDWIKTFYDLPDENANLPIGYTQSYVRGAVSHSQNANIHTWYSYDELGRVTWMAQKPVGLPRTFIVKYNYDFLGNVLLVSNLAYDMDGALKEQFYHHYEYDKDKRLSKAYTSTTFNGVKNKRSEYEYYLHGPLKRIVLGNNLQGIDFVYNINGWLTQINHPDTNQDPGHDGDGNGVKKDVFGMVLDYYESDLNNLLVTGTKNNLHEQRHHLPSGAYNTTVSHLPLIRFESPASFTDSPTTTTSFKDYGIQNPKYKEMILENQGTH